MVHKSYYAFHLICKKCPYKLYPLWLPTIIIGEQIIDTVISKKENKKKKKNIDMRKTQSTKYREKLCNLTPAIAVFVERSYKQNNIF